MKRLLFLAALLMAVGHLQAQQIVNRKYVNRKYQDLSLSEVLKDIDRQSRHYTIHFIYNELEDFRVTTDIHRLSVPDAVRQAVGFYPMRVTVSDSLITVECTHKTDRHLTGTIVDEQGQPVAYANVALLNPADSTLLSGGVSNESGVFVIPYEQQQVLARISYVGYKTVWRLCDKENVGTIQLQPETYSLKNVYVKGYRPTMKMIAGGMEIDVQNTILAQAGSAIDVLGQLPRVTVKGNNAVEVFGKGRPEIYINGRKMRSADELQQLQSKDIKSVEVITMPGAKYSAQLEAVIRINTVKRRGDGFSLYSIARGKYFHEASGVAGVSMTYRKNSLEMNFYPYYSNSYSGEDNHFGSVLHTSDHTLSTMQTGLYKDRTQSFVPDFKLSYDFDENHSVGGSYRYQTTLKAKDSFTSDYTVDRDGTPVDHVVQDGPHDWDVNNHNANVYYIGKIGKWNLQADGSYVHSIVDRGQHITEWSQTQEDRTVNTSSTQDSRLYAGKLTADYRLPKGELSLGTELSHSNVHADNHNPEGYISESDDRMRESNYAGFASFDLPLGHWTIGAGLRYEHVSADYYSYNVRYEDISRAYDGLFPNVYAAWNKGAWGVQFGYAKKTRRPAYGQLRSYQQYDNRYAYEGGNPRLLPAINHDVEFMVNWKWVNLSLDYTYTEDYMLWRNSLYPGQEAAYANWININHKQDVSASLVLQPKFSWYQPKLEVNYVQQFFDARSYGFVTSLRRPALGLDLTNRFVIDKTCWLSLQGIYSKAHDTMSQEVRPFGTVNLRVYKSFMKGALALNLGVKDIFNTNKERWMMRTTEVEISKDCKNHQDMRGVQLQVTYNFNTTRSKYKGTGAGNAEKNRL